MSHARSVQRYAVRCALAGLLALALPSAAEAKTHLVSVWALMQADAPVAGGKVSLVTVGAHPRRIALKHAETTNKNGIALVNAASPLPRDFTAVVRGGTVDGVAIRGTMRAEMHGYDKVAVAYVNPATSLVVEHRRLHPRIGFSQAVAHAKHLLGLPSWQDISVGLRRSNTYFHGRRFLNQALKHGGVDGYIRSLAREIDSKPQGRHVFVGGPADHKIAPRQAAAVTAEVESLAEKLLGKLASSAGSYIGQQALGWVCAQFGLSSGIDSQIAQIQTTLTTMSDNLGKLTNEVGALKTQLAKTQYAIEVQLDDPLLGAIDTAEGDLVSLANATSDSDKAAWTTETLDLIGSTQLLTGEATLNKDLTNANGILNSYQYYVGSKQIVGPADSANVQAVQDYFAGYQAELANLLAERLHAKGFGADTVTAAVTTAQTNIASQQAMLATPVPLGTVVDTGSNLMWISQPSTAAWEERYINSPTTGALEDPILQALAVFQQYPQVQNYVDANGQAQQRTVTGWAGFPDWFIADQDQLDTLMTQWPGVAPGGPVAWIADHDGISDAGTIQNAGGNFWTDNVAYRMLPQDPPLVFRDFYSIWDRTSHQVNDYNSDWQWGTLGIVLPYRPVGTVRYFLKPSS